MDVHAKDLLSRADRRNGFAALLETTSMAHLGAPFCFSSRDLP
jgi:hypothetical protein